VTGMVWYCSMHLIIPKAKVPGTPLNQA
jgi:hypothetical protein